MSKVAKAAVSLMGVTIIAKILGFGRELVLASAYGTSAYSDAYLAALNIPNVIFSIIGVGLMNTFIPIYYEVFKEQGEIGANKFTSNIINIVTIFSIFIAGAGFVFSEYLVRIFAIGFEGETFNVAVSFTRIFMAGIVFIGFNNIISSYLQIKENFVIPGLITVPGNIIIMVSIVLSLKYGIYVMALGTLIGTIGQFIFQLPFLCREGYKHKLYININDKYIRKMTILIAPVLIGVAVNQVNVMIDKTIASTLTEGSISALNYANRLNLFVTGLFTSSIGAVIYPMLSKLSSENNKDKFVQSIVTSTNSIILLVIPISAGAMVLAKPIVELLFERGAFDKNATEMTAIALIFYSIGMLSFGLRDVLGKIFYALKDTRTPMINGVIAILMNILLNIILVKYMGHAGLALATSISATLCIILLFISLKKRIGYFGQDKIFSTIIKSLIASFIMAIMTNLTYGAICNIIGRHILYKITALFISILVGVLLYGGMLIILKVNELKLIKEIITDKILMRKNDNFIKKNIC